MDKDLRDNVSIDGDIITIYGIRYAGPLFETFALAPIGTQLEIIQRNDGVITVKILKRAEAVDA